VIPLSEINLRVARARRIWEPRASKE
jgi:hypothetical protein